MRYVWLPVAISIAACGSPGNVSTNTGTLVQSEQPVDSPVNATTGMTASDASIAFDGVNYLVVWADARDGLGQSDIWATRITQSGAIVDGANVLVARSSGVQAHPAVAFDGTRYVVVWEDFKTVGGTEADLAAATVSIAGVVTTIPSPAATPTHESTPVLAASGSTVLVTWLADNQIRGSIFNGSFGATFAITTTPGSRREPAVAGIPGGPYLVAFTEDATATGEDTRGQLVGNDGSLLGAAFDISNGNVATRAPTVGVLGNNFVVAFSSYWLGVDIYATRVTPTGTVLDTHFENGVVIGGKLINGANNYQETPSITCDASGCLVAWQDKRNLAVSGYDLYAQVVSLTLDRVGTDFAITRAPLSQLQPRVMTRHDGYFAIWRDARAGGNAALRIGSARLSQTGEVLDPDGIVVNRGNNGEYGPALARAGTVVSLAWNDSRALWGDDLEHVRFTSDGAKIDNTARQISGASYAQADVASAGSGTSFVHAWTDFRDGVTSDIYSAHTSASTGTVIGGAVNLSVGLPGQHATPAVASSGSNALIVWIQVVGADKNILGAVVDNAGNASPPFLVSDSTGEQARPAVAFDCTSNQYVVAWMDMRAGRFDIYGTRVAVDGAVLDPSGVQIATASSGNRLVPRIATVNGVDLVVYSDSRNGNWDIYATRVSTGSAMTVLDPGGIQITMEPSHQGAPDVTAVGNRFFVAWSDERSLQTTQHDIWGQTVTTTGTLDGTSFAVAHGTDDELTPAVIGTSSSTLILSYVRQRLDIHARRVVSRYVQLSTGGDHDDDCDPDTDEHHHHSDDCDGHTDEGSTGGDHDDDCDPDTDEHHHHSDDCDGDTDEGGRRGSRP